MTGNRTPKRVGRQLCALATGCTLAWVIGCGGGAALHRSGRAGFANGADGDREVAEGPGLFSGERGGLEFDLLDLLKTRARSRANRGVQEDGPE